MAKVHERKARKDYPQSGIAKGETYFFAQIKTGPRSSRTIRSKVRPKRYELTTSDFYGRLWRIEDESFAGVCEASDLRDIAEEVRQLGEEQQEKFDNMPDGLQQGDTGQLIEERANACEEWAGEIENAADELEAALDEFDKAVENDPGEDDRPEDLQDVDLEDEDAVRDARNEVVQRFVSQAEDANPGIN